MTSIFNERSMRSQARRSQERIRLDLLANPFGPTERVIDAIVNADHDHGQNRWIEPAAKLESQLKAALGARAGVPASWVVLANGIDELHAMIALWRSDFGPLLVFPPTDPGLVTWIRRHASQVEEIPRGPHFSIPVTANGQTLPRGATSVVMSPNDPTGTAITVHEAVRLSRQSAFTVIDERHAAYSSRSILPLAREFDNLIVLQTFETWAGLPAHPLAWAIAPPQIIRELERFTRPTGIARMPVVAGLASLEESAALQASVHRVMVEKGRLFRQIRKLSMISPPYASWANFLLCRIERGTNEFFVPRLAERGIDVFPVTNPELPNHLRVSAVSADATNAIKQAMIDIALDL
ncbi:MAG: aminotransferase class I/II-fold pyridoxal phosphate-dependent enzyme [Thermomicrobiales bacterium]